MTVNAFYVPNAKQQFLSATGVPLAGGSVYMYIPSTTTFKNTWQDSGQVTLNTNPIILDGNGEATIYGTGNYRQQVYDNLNNLVWDQVVSSGSYGLLVGANNLSDVASASTSLANLGGLPLTGGSLSGNLAVGGTLGVTGVTTLTGGGTSVTPAAGDNSTKIATTAFVQAALTPQITVLTSGSGTYTTPSGASYLKVRMVGGGGGGAATGGSASGGGGGTTSFGTSLLTATGGAGGPTGGAGGAGGTPTVNSPATNVNSFQGPPGMSYTSWGLGSGTLGVPGAIGASGPMGAGGVAASTGAGYGAGGGGASGSGTANSDGCGGGYGGYVEAIITSPSASYAYVVGAAGAAASGAGAGTSGAIIIEAY